MSGTDDWTTLFYTLADQAMREGLLSREERDLISRAGTRKAWAWRRHVLDLAEILEQRLAERQMESTIAQSCREAKERARV